MRDSWQEKTYPSLSTIAQAITGTRSRTRFPVSIARTRRPESNLSIKIITPWWRHGHCADEALRPVVEMHRAFQLMGQTTLDHPRAEPFTGWWRDGRTVLLLPAQDYSRALSSVLRRPLNHESSQAGDDGTFRRWAPPQ
jgi:hypothetical protein